MKDEKAHHCELQITNYRGHPLGGGWFPAWLVGFGSPLRPCDNPAMLAAVALAVTMFVCVLLYFAARAFTAASAFVLAVLAGIVAVIARSSLIAGDLFVLATALFLGVLIGQFVRSRMALSAFVIAAASADVISFFAGPTRYLLSSSRPEMLRYLAIRAAIGGHHVAAIIGVGDLILFSACSVALRCCQYPEWTAFVLPIAGLLGALLSGLAFGPLPALPFLAAAILGYQFLASRRQKRLKGR